MLSPPCESPDGGLTVMMMDKPRVAKASAKHTDLAATSYILIFRQESEMNDDDFSGFIAQKDPLASTLHSCQHRSRSSSQTNLKTHFTPSRTPSTPSRIPTPTLINLGVTACGEVDLEIYSSIPGWYWLMNVSDRLT